MATVLAGTPVDPRNILRTIQIAAEKAGMGRMGVHTLRHSAAVVWLEQGVHIKAVADLLGHSSIAVTGDIYGHKSDQAAKAAIEGLSGRSDSDWGIHRWERGRHTLAPPKTGA